MSDTEDARRAGYGLASAATLIGLLPMAAGHPPRWSALGIAIILALLATGVPRALSPLIWLSHQLGRLCAVVTVGLAYFAVLTPAALLARLLGRKPLALRPDRAAATYWIARAASGTDLRRQY